MRLVELLVAEQRKSGLSDERFAAFLGVPRSTWQLTRTGRKRAGRTVIAATVAAFPHLAPVVLEALQAGA